MKLILVRHGEAGVHAYDELRELTPRGEQQTVWTAEHILASYTPDLIVVSPLIRAQQTAAQLVGRCSTARHVTYEGIKPEDDAKHALEWISRQHGQCVVVVCHMNIIAYMHALLTDTDPNSFELAEYRVYDQLMMVPGFSVLEFSAAPQF